MNHHHSSFVSEETLESLHAFKISETSIFPRKHGGIYLGNGRTWIVPGWNCVKALMMAGITRIVFQAGFSSLGSVEWFQALGFCLR